MHNATTPGKTTPPAGPAPDPILPASTDLIVSLGYYSAAAAAAAAAGEISADEISDFANYLAAAGPDALLVNYYR